MRKKSIRVRALKNSLARRVFSEMGMDGLSRYLEGPSVLVWGGDGVAELAKEVSTQVKTLKKPEIKGGAVDGVVIGPNQVEDITKLPSREALIGRVVSLALAPVQRIVALANAPAGNLMGQLKTHLRRGRRRGGEPAEPAEAGGPTRAGGLSARHMSLAAARHRMFIPGRVRRIRTSGCFLISIVPVRLTHAPRMIMI